MAGVLDTMMTPEVSTEILADAFHFEVAVKSSGYCGGSTASLPVPPATPPVPGSSSPLDDPPSSFVDGSLGVKSALPEASADTDPESR